MLKSQNIILGIVTIIEFLLFALFVYLKSSTWILIAFVIIIMCTLGQLFDLTDKDSD